MALTIERIPDFPTYEDECGEVHCSEVLWQIGDKHFTVLDDKTNKIRPLNATEKSQYDSPIADGFTSAYITGVYDSEKAIDWDELERLGLFEPEPLTIKVSSSSNLTWWTLMTALSQWHNKFSTHDEYYDHYGHVTFFEGFIQVGVHEGLPVFSVYWGS